MRLASAIRFDIVLQFRHGFYFVTAILAAVYVMFLRMIPDDYTVQALTYVIFTDPSILGFFFIGGIILLEHGEHTIEGLFITPLRPWEYILSKTAALLVPGLLSSLIVAVLVRGLQFNVPVFIIAVMLTSVFFTLLGFTLAARVTTINSYLIASIGYVSVFHIPVLDYFGIYQHPLFYLLPTKASLVLFTEAFGGHVGAPHIIYALLTLTVWITGAFIWAHRWFVRYIVRRSGDAS
jgi:fluoroquinolone transport system permease protein